jgi:DNA polymerase-3 subunit alpha
VIRYVAEKYGRDRVAQIITFGTLGAKAAIRDSARALGIPLSETDRVARMVPNQLNISVADAIAQSSELRAAGDEDPLIEELLSYAQRLNGVVRNVSTHAAGVVISQEPLAENVPLRRPASESEGDDWIPMTQWGMDEVAAVGLLKMDFLGLTNLTILEEAVELELGQRRAESEHPGDEQPIDYVSLADGDAKTFAALETGDTFGVFQLESGGMRRVVADLKPTSIRDLAALLALYRPGPMEHIPRFIESRHGRTRVTYPHGDLGEILDDTYGVIVYQDQVLHIARKFAGYTLGEADVMRKAMGKKIAAVMQAERGNFVNGAVDQGYSRDDANTIFELIEPFAGYAFNKAHAVSYAAIAYQTAWFKANHPAPYMAAVLRAAAGNADRVRAAAAECGRLDIPLLQPDVNHSQKTFTLERTSDGRSAIRFGLGTIKNVGMGAVEPLIEEREANGPLQGFADLCDRIDAKSLNRRALESLAKAGAFDSIAPRGPMVAAAEDILKRARRAQELRDSGQMSMFDLFGQEVDTPTPEVALSDEIDATPQEQLHWERELLGTYVSQHPLQAAERALQGRVDAQLSELTEDMAGRTVTVAGLVNNIRLLTTRKGDTFCAVMLEDLSGSAELTVWPEQYRATKEIWEPNKIVVARASIRSRNDRLTIAVDRANVWDEDAEPRAIAAPPKIPALPAPPAALPAPEPVVPPPPPVAAAPPPPAPASAGTVAPALWISLSESDDAAADSELLERMEHLLRGVPGEHAVFLRIQTIGGEEIVLACSDAWRVNAAFATVSVVNALLGERGSAELGSSAPTASGADAAAGG